MRSRWIGAWSRALPECSSAELPSVARLCRLCCVHSHTKRECCNKSIDQRPSIHMPPHARLVDEPAATPRSGSRANPLRTRPRRMTTLEILAKDGRERIAKMKQQASRMKTAPGVQGEPPTLVGRIVDPAGSDDTERALRAKAQRERAEQEEVTIAAPAE